MRTRNTDVLAYELRIVNPLAVGLDVGDARTRVCVRFDDAPVEDEVARRGVERDGDLHAALQQVFAGEQFDVERVADVPVVRRAPAREFARDARLKGRLRGLRLGV